MNREVIITQRAARELSGAARWWAEHHSPTEAERWYNKFFEALLTLEHNPERCAAAREQRTFPYEIRQLLFGVGRRFTHRAVFTIRDNTIVVLAIRHLARQDVTPDEVD